MAQEESLESNDVSQVIKGKRTKRQRSSSPYKVALTSSSSSGVCAGGGDGGSGVVVEEYGSSSPTTSGTLDQVCESTEEEEYLANCLILLAQGDGPRPIEKDIMEKFSARQEFSAMATPNLNKAGFYVYECKTCNRSFPSFQALGGHRASHKKPKAMVEEKKAPAAASMDDHEDCQLNKSSSDFISLEIANNKGFHSAKPKIHECSICGSEFTSGQALGGHMRRHRAGTSNKADSSVDNTSMATIKSNVIGDHDHHQIKRRNTLALDLNLPAPEDDHHHRESKFQLVSTQQVLVFSAPALVDCHY